MHVGLMEMGPPKWPKQACYISFLAKEETICEDLMKQRACACGSKLMKKGQSLVS